MRTQRRRRVVGWGLTVAGDGTLLGTDSSAELYTMAMAEDGGLEEKHRVTIRDGRRKVRQHPIHLNFDRHDRKELKLRIWGVVGR